MIYAPSMSAEHALEVIQGGRTHILILLHFLEIFHGGFVCTVSHILLPDV